jgi:hypothetical protein
MKGAILTMVVLLSVGVHWSATAVAAAHDDRTIRAPKEVTELRFRRKICNSNDSSQCCLQRWPKSKIVSSTRRTSVDFRAGRAPGRFR